tara:strand:+ start:23597 stop:23833 length:237 start_codon:yes stop_codon:yes gene_type:complete
MHKNVGIVDKTVRLAVAAIALWATHTGQVEGGISIALIIIAIAMILSASYSFCFLYKILGINTCHKCCGKKCDVTPKE